MGGSFIFRFVSFLSTHNKAILLLLISSLFCFVFSFFCVEVFQEGLWKDTSFEDPDLHSLSSRLQATVLLARAPRTVKMYDRAFRRRRNTKSSELTSQRVLYPPRIILWLTGCGMSLRKF